MASRSSLVNVLVCVTLLSCQLVTSDDTTAQENNWDCRRFPPVDHNEDTIEDEPLGTVPKYSQLYSSKTSYLNVRDPIRHLYDMSWPAEQRQCQPLYLYLTSRHSIRYPKTKEIDEFGELEQWKQHFISSDAISDTFKNELVNWQLLMHPTEDQHIAQAGQFETAVLARIFYMYFPSLLDVRKSNIEVAATKLVRTTQTAFAFLRGLAEFQLRSNERTFEESNQDISEWVHRFNIPPKELLLVHEQLKHMRNRPPKHSKIYEDIIRSDGFQALVERFRDRYQLPSLDVENIQMLWRICAYELANFRTSPWCSLFTEDEAAVIEYLHDADNFNNAYGHKANREIGCFIIRDLYDRLNAFMENPEQSAKSTLHFSHGRLIQKIASYFGLFDKFPEPKFTEDGICISKERTWYSSAVMPFNANFAAVLHKCADQNGNPLYKLLFLFNEIPVSVPGCDDDTFCELNKFMKHYEEKLQSCNLQKILRQ